MFSWRGRDTRAKARRKTGNRLKYREHREVEPEVSGVNGPHIQLPQRGTVCQCPEPSGQGKGVILEPKPDPHSSFSGPECTGSQMKAVTKLPPPSLASCLQEGNLPVESYLPISPLSSLLPARSTAHTSGPALHSSTSRPSGWAFRPKHLMTPPWGALADTPASCRRPGLLSKTPPA